ncbi:MAG: exodeoxyribonuclease VII large subunit [Candidatus Thermoplasmatota archaeon]|nr:exodeoxyribonuclease VII large subunit [Candidatus Thermoplasmatota archaeon]
MPEEAQRIFSVTEVTDTIRNLLRDEPSLIGVAVRGELSDYGKSAQGHCYFTMKDEDSSLKCVLFRGDAERLGLDIEDGQKIVASGDIDVYRPSGSYQLIVREVKLEGVGELYQKFLRLKKLLETEGLFAEEHKKPLPEFPVKIGVVTSEKGAAFRDIVKVLGRRFPLADIILAPTLVQGADAPGFIVSAIEALNRYDGIDVMIVGRGGGAFEDLACFNDESVARTIFDSHVPVVSAVGHETDFTIADFVADRRAATPSAAAEIVAPDIMELHTSLDTDRESLVWGLRNMLESRRRDIKRLESSLSSDVVLDQIRTHSQRLDDRFLQMNRALESFLVLQREGLRKLGGILGTADPLATLDRGYSIAMKLPDKDVIETIESVTLGDDVLVMVRDGEIYCVVRNLKEVERRPRK